MQMHGCKRAAVQPLGAAGVVVPSQRAEPLDVDCRVTFATEGTQHSGSRETKRLRRFLERFVLPAGNGTMCRINSHEVRRIGWQAALQPECLIHLECSGWNGPMVVVLGASTGGLSNARPLLRMPYSDRNR